MTWGAVGVLAAAVAAARRNPRAVRDRVRTFNRDVFNPVVLRYAGRGAFYASVVRHTGRRSGRTYTTPVVAEPVDGGFLVPLPYGEDTDWCRNVLAAGHATLERRGTTTEVTDPQVVHAAEVRAQLPAARWWALHLAGTARFLRLRTAPGH